MHAKSASSARSRKLDRPFEREILERAKAIAASYQIILQVEEGEYFGRGLEMPFVMADGHTPDACVKATREALTAAVATTLERGEIPPPPASEQKRSEQVNIRLTAEEKMLLEETARTKGFRGVGDYVRTTTLANLRP